MGSAGQAGGGARGSLALGPVVVARRPAGAERRVAAGGEFVALYLPRGGAEDRLGEAYVAEGVGAPGATAGRDCVALLAPHRFLSGVMQPGRAPGPLPRSVALSVLQRYLDGLLELDSERLCGRQADLAASAVHALLSAAMASAGGEQGLGSRRRSSLLEEVVAHVEADLCAPLSADDLCEALGCSRSALYRATAPAGGVAELVLNRRLTAVRDLLLDPREPRTITALATAHGFTDTAQFNRRFKGLFGVPPGEVRRGVGRSFVRTRRREPSRPANRRIARARP